MIILRNKSFSSKNKEESYGDIDEQAPNDPYYYKGFEKWGKRVAIGSGAGVVAGTGLVAAGGKKGEEAASKISKLKDRVDSSENFRSHYEGEMSRNDWFGKSAEKEVKQYDRKIKAAREEIDTILKKYGKKVKLNRSGKVISGTAAVTGALGTAAYLGSKLGQNTRKSVKKDIKDVLVQSKNDSKKK